MSSPTVGYATLQIIPSLKGVDKKIRDQVGGSSRAAGSSGGKILGSGLAAGVKKALLPLAGIVAGAVAIDYLKDAVAAASDLGETTSKVSVIFGKKALPGLEKFASAAATKLGQSKQAALDATATFGTMGKVAGLQGPQLAGFSTKLVTLSSDLASFGNTSPEEAIEAIGSALRGEAEPIRKYGILLDDATLRNEALKLGLIKTTKDALTPQQKVLAAQAAIMKQSTDAQGDFGRTSGGLANQQRILAANLTNVKTTIGGFLLPIVTKVTSFIVARVVPAFQSFAEWAGPKIEAAIAGISSFISDTIIPAVQNLAAWLGPRFTKVVAAVSSFISGTLVPTLKEFAEYIGPKIQAAASVIVPILQKLISGLLEKLPVIFADVADKVKTLTAFVRENGATFLVFFGVLAAGYAALKLYALGVKVVQLATKAWAAVQFVLNAVMTANPLGLIIVAIALLAAGITYAWQNSETFRSVVIGAWEAIRGFVMPVVETLRNAIVAAFEFIRGVVVAVWPVVQRIITVAMTIIRTYVVTYITIVRTVITVAFNIIRTVTSTVWNIVKNVITTTITVVRTIVTTYINIVRTVVTTAWNTISSVTSTVWNAIKGVVTGVVDRIKGAIETLSTIVSTVTGFFGRVKEAISTKLGEAVTFVTGIPGKIIAALGNLGQLLLSAGGDLIGGLIQGIKDKSAELISTITSFITDKIPGFIKDRLGISSPSKVTARLGRFISEGLAVGIKGGGPGIRDAIKSITDQVASLFDEKKITKTQRDGLKTLLAKQDDDLAKAATSRARIARKLVAANEQLANARSFASDIAGGILSSGSITDVEGKATETGTARVTVADITARLKESVASSGQFLSQLKSLAKRGLSKSLLKQFTEAGFESAGDEVAALARGSSGEIKLLNQLQGQLAGTATATGRWASNQFQTVGIAMAEGAVEGLKSRLKKTTAAATSLVTEIVKVVKRQLGIKSPSTVFAGIGGNIGAGLVLGIEGSAQDVKRSVLGLVPSVRGPGASTIGAAGGVGRTYVTTINNPPQPSTAEQFAAMTDRLDRLYAGV